MLRDQEEAIAAEAKARGVEYTAKKIEVSDDDEKWYIDYEEKMAAEAARKKKLEKLEKEL